MIYYFRHHGQAQIPIIISIHEFCSVTAADSEPESAESDDEFQICQICNSETVLSSESYPICLSIFGARIYCDLLSLILGKEKIAPMFMLQAAHASCMFSATYDRINFYRLVLPCMHRKN